jgi:hypothetical protein
MARLEMAVPADPARACPSAGRPGPVEVEEGVSWIWWWRVKASWPQGQR